MFGPNFFIVIFIFWMIITAIGVVLSIIGISLLIRAIIMRRKIKKPDKKPKALLITSIIILTIGILISMIYPYNLINEKNALINSEFPEGKYPVINAVMKNDVSKVSELLKSGGDPNEFKAGPERDTYEKIPVLFYACSYGKRANNFSFFTFMIGEDKELKSEEKTGNPEMVKLLIKNGAELNYVGKYNNKKCELTDWIFKYEYMPSPEVLQILKDNGLNIDKPDLYGLTPLMWACSHSSIRDDSNVAPVKWLIKSGANVNAVDKKGRTALMWACKSNDYFCPINLEVVSALVNNGADISIKDNNKMTALTYLKKTRKADEKWFDYEEYENKKEYKDLYTSLYKMLDEKKSKLKE